jgi:hypothetical protein
MEASWNLEWASVRTRIAEATLEADELHLVVAGFLHPLRDTAGRTDRWAVVPFLGGVVNHSPSVDWTNGTQGSLQQMDEGRRPSCH